MVVTANMLEVKVLGTRFDVSAYPEDKLVKVVLESGRVELDEAKGNSLHYELKPGEMATCNVVGNQVTISKVETRLFTAWKDGLMIFRDDPMAVVISQLERRFAKLLNLSVGDYIQSLRLTAARELLETSDRTITDIGQSVGFYDHSHFSRKFRRWMGVSPDAYRRSHRSGK